jgi:hypothetical protein
MGVPAAAPPVKVLEPAGSGKLRLFSTAAVAVAVVALAVALAVQVIPKEGQPATQGNGQAASPMDEPAAAAVRAVTHSVVYQLLGDAGVRDITFVADGAVLSQESSAATPWVKTLRRTGVEGGTEFYSVTAQNAGQGTLRCRIVVDGQVVSEETATGDRAMVSCAR